MILYKKKIRYKLSAVCQSCKNKWIRITLIFVVKWRAHQYRLKPDTDILVGQNIKFIKVLDFELAYNIVSLTNIA